MQFPGLNSWMPPMAYTIKVLVGFYFLYVYTVVYGNGALSADAGAFMKESAVINHIFFESPSDYFKFLFGIGDNQVLIDQYLVKTSHWDSGAQAIISDNRNILRIHSLIHFFSFGYTSIHVLIMCFISLIGLNQLYKSLRAHTAIKDIYLFLILLLFPSILFWTSGILKEPILLLGIGLFVRSILGSDSLRKKLTLGLIALILLIGFKPYVLLAAVPSLVFYTLYHFFPKLKVLGVTVIMALCLFIFSWMFKPQINHVVHIFSQKQFDFKNVGKGGLHAGDYTRFYFFQPEQIESLEFKGDSVRLKREMDVHILRHGSMEPPIKVHLKPTDKWWFIYFQNVKSDGYIDLTMIHNSPKQMILNIPEALVNSLFRPFFFDPGSWLKYPAMLESIALFLFLVFSILNRRILNKKDVNLVVSIAIFVISLSLIIGWVTPVLGAIVRYRIPAYLGILIIALLIIKPKNNLNNE